MKIAVSVAPIRRQRGFGWLIAVLGWCVLLLGASCAQREERLAPRALTWAELRTVRSGVRVTPPGEASRVPFARERLSDGSKVEVAAGGLAWLRRDAGATLLVRGPAQLVLRARAITVIEGRIFADTPPGNVTELETPAQNLALTNVRASITVEKAGPVRAYVLAGEVRTKQARATAGEELVLESKDVARVHAVRAWEDWTGGLATTDRSAAPAPFGVGTVGARRAGEQGSPRFPLAIQRMDVRVTFDGDFAVTEVDQTFFNPSSDVVEGIYGFRTPERAILQRFGVDREGVVVWGRVKEKSAAAIAYQASVYEGSTEDPALLEWDAPGVYRARLYPIGPGAARRVVVRYAEWLDRSGESAERRLYVYPMAAQGSEESLPQVEEFKATFDLARAKAKEVRVGMTGVRRGDELVVREHDFVPRADLAVELLDDGGAANVAYVAPHAPDLAALPPSERKEAAKQARGEMDYLLVPVRSAAAKLPEGGLDLVIVVDASAATERATLTLARAATSALLSHLGDRDRALVLAGDASLRPVAPGLTQLSKVDAALRTRLTDALADVSRGGATDLGSLLAEAARKLDPSRRSAVVYIGDAQPTVGELSLAALRERLSRLPHPARVFGLGIGDAARLDLLAGLSRGAFAERITDGAQAARAALLVLEAAERPVWLGTRVELGPSVERVFPREASALVNGETLWVVGRLLPGKEPNRIKITSPAGGREHPLELTRLEDYGDLARRWAEARLGQMLEEGEGRAALVDLGMKNGIITPVTSFYVPTATAMDADERAELEARRVAAKGNAKQQRGDRSEAAATSMAAAPGAAAPPADNKEGGDGRRPAAASKGRSTADDAPAEASKEQAVRAEERNEQGLIGRPTTAAKTRMAAPATPAAVAAPEPVSPPEQAPVERQAASRDDGKVGNAWGDLDQFASPGVGRSSAALSGGLRPGQGGGGLTLSGTGRLGGSRHSAASAAPARAKKPPRLVVNVFIGELPRQLFGCSAAAEAPLEARVALWRERLAKFSGSALAVATVYWNALANCEAYSFRERSRLLSLMLDVMPGVSGRVSLYQMMLGDLGAAEVLYRGILGRIKTPDEMRELHAALGLKNMDPGILAKIIDTTADPRERAARLRALAAQFPDDFDLALAVLYALEDSGDVDAARDAARRLRERVDADARVRTALGELYLRLGARETGAERKAFWVAEAQRAFGEIVEFAPEDPVTRRRLGDLLLSHGFFAEAERQYATLATLTPDDSKVFLLLAAAAEGQGLLEESLRWSEKAGAAGAPDELSGAAATARALAATHLAWGRAEARKAQRSKELEALTARASRVLASGRADPEKAPGARVSLTWSHPELHPTLWTNALRTTMPAPEGDVTLGVLQAIVPERDSSFVEVRLEPADVAHVARLGAVATLTVVFDELGKGEKIVRMEVRFERGGAATQRFLLAGKEVRRG